MEFRRLWGVFVQPSRGWHQRWRRIWTVPQRVRQATSIFHERFETEENVPGRPGTLACEVDLIECFLLIPTVPNGANRVSRPDMTVLVVLPDPPVQQDRIWLIRRRNLPIKLWGVVIAPALVEPKLCICIKLVVLVESFHDRRISRPPDSKRTDAELNPLFLRLCAFINLLDEKIHLRSPPVVAGEFAASLEIFLPSWFIWEIGILDALRRRLLEVVRIRIEIVVHVDAVDVIPMDDVCEDSQ